MRVGKCGERFEGGRKRMDKESAREARRRKILERGSARLAFITGQASSLPPSTVDHSVPPQPSVGGGCKEDGLQVAECTTSETPFEKETADDHPSFESFLKDEEILTSSEFMPPGSREIEPEATDDDSRHPVTNTGPKSRKSLAHIFTAQIISSSISASENIRLLCALSIAILTVLSFPGLTVRSDSLCSIVSFRPIYMVLLTDLSLLIGMVYTSRWEKREEGLKEKNGAQESGEWFDQMGKALELLIILQKVAGAVFADCCLCALIVVCGISFRTSL